MRVKGLLAVATASYLAACHTHAPLTREAATPGLPVRAGLVEPSERRSGGLFGPRASVEVEGELVRWDAEALVLSVAARRHAGMPLDYPTRDTVVIRPTNLALVEQKRFSPGRTAALAAGGSLVAALVVRSLLGRGGGAERDPIDTQEFVRIR